MARMTRRRFLGAVAGVGLALVLPVHAAGARNSFVRRRGRRLVLDGESWPMYGASSYGTTNPGGPVSIADLIRLARGARLNTIRIVNFLDEGSPSGAPDPAVAAYDPASWARVDALLDALRRAEMKAILDLSTYRNLLQNWLLATGGTTTPYSEDWGQFIEFVATRQNTVSQRLYRADPTIAIVSFAGEPNPPASGEPLKPTTAELTAFYATAFAEWRGHDQQHLLCAGGFIHLDWEERFGNPNGSGIDWQAIFALADNDVPAVHTYPAIPTPSDDVQSPKVSQYCAAIGKPWITEEFGLPQSAGDAARAAWFRDVYGIQRRFRSSGVAFWNLGPELSPPASSSFDVNPSTPQTWRSVKANAPS